MKTVNVCHPFYLCRIDRKSEGGHNAERKLIWQGFLINLMILP